MGRDAPWLPPGHCIVPGPKVQAGRPDRHPKNPTGRQLPCGLWCSQNPPSSPSPSPCGRSLSRRGSAPPPHSFAQYGVSAPFTSTQASTRRGMEEMSRFSTAPRLLFSHRTAFRTRTRSGKVYKAKDRKHPKVHTRSPPYAGTLQAGRQGAVSQRSKASQAADQIS